MIRNYSVFSLSSDIFRLNLAGPSKMQSGKKPENHLESMSARVAELADALDLGPKKSIF